MVDDLDCRLTLEVGTKALVRRGKPLPCLTLKSLASRTAHKGKYSTQESVTYKVTESSGAGCAVRLLLSCTLRYCATLLIRLNRPAKLHT